MLNTVLSDFTNLAELERIWDAYSALLVKGVLREIQKADSTSADTNTSHLFLISVKKLYKEAKMYMNIDEITAILRGNLRAYIDQFMQEDDHYEDMSDDEPIRINYIYLADQPKSPPNSNKPPVQLMSQQSDVINEYNQFGGSADERRAKRGSTASAKRRYIPDEMFSNKNSVLVNELDTDMRRREQSFINDYNSESLINERILLPNGSADHSNGFFYGVVYLDFKDFYDLMKLKIEFQRKAIMQNETSDAFGTLKAMGSVEYAAVRAYSKRMSDTGSSQAQQSFARKSYGSN